MERERRDLGSVLLKVVQVYGMEGSMAGELGDVCNVDGMGMEAWDTDSMEDTP